MEKGTKKRLVLLDAHAILHRAYHALPQFSSSKGEPTGALYGLAAMLIKITADLKPDYLVAAYDLPKPTYRHEAYKEYKAGRAKADPELVAQIIRSRDVFAALAIPIYEKEGFEADDILGTIVEQLKIKNSKLKIRDDDVDIIIASGDMDTLQLVDGKRVQVYTLKKGINDTILYDEKAVMERFGFLPKFLPDYKGLRGDPSDNIIGIKGIGEKTASILIQKFGTIENLYKVLKKDAKKVEAAGVSARIVQLLKDGEEEAEFSKMLGTIRRDAPILFELSKQEWKEEVSLPVATKFFGELEFRTLSNRLKEVLGGYGKVKEGEGEAGRASTPAPQKEISEVILRPVSVARWLVNSSVTNPTLEDILNFGNTDSFETAREKIFAELKKRNLTRVFEEIEQPLIPIIAKMDERGVKINKAYLKKLSTEYHAVLASLQKKIWDLAGGEFNVSSPKQLGEILFVKLGLVVPRQKKTAGGALSTKESELEKLREAHPIIALILEYRELAKLLGTYIDTIPEQVGADGRLHANFLQAGTTTGRMGCENPNLQNIPNKTDLGRKIRNAFVAERGFKLVSFDYSQIELRIAAFLSGDEKLIEIFKRGEDVHTAVAAEVFGVSGDKVHYDMRRRAKVINFGVMYGMGVNALRANLGVGVSREEAQKFYDEYFKKFSGLAAYLEEIKKTAAQQGYTETFFGRRRYFEGLTSKLPFIRAAAERMAINAPIQGTEADVIKIAMIRADEFLKKEKLADKAFLLLQVHDELVYEVAEECVARIASEIKKIMESVLLLKDTLGVPVLADVSVGDNWGEMGKL